MHSIRLTVKKPVNDGTPLEDADATLPRTLITDDT